MSEGYSRSPKLLKGAIVQFKEMPIIPIPNIIIFQYNPDSLARSLSPFAPAATPEAKQAAEGGKQPVAEGAQPYDPTETFTVTLLLDASDALEAPESHPVAFVTGVADRMAALEMLLYPAGDSLLGGLVGSLSLSVGGLSLSTAAFAEVKRTEVPVTLFIWGPGRIVPVRLTSFNVEEQQWNQLLYPTRAKVSVGMKVMTSAALGAADSKSATNGKDIAKFCYDFTRGQKEVLALANMANTVESILGILPF